MLLHDATGVKEKSEHNFINIMNFWPVTKEGKKWVVVFMSFNFYTFQVYPLKLYIFGNGI